MTINIGLKLGIFAVAVTNTQLAHAVVERCDQSVNFYNGNTYKDVSGEINCFLNSKPTVKTQTVMLRKGKKHGKKIIYAPFYYEDAPPDKVMVIEHYRDGLKDGEFIHYNEKGDVERETIYQADRMQRQMHSNLFNGGKSINYYRPSKNHSGEETVGSLSYNAADQLTDKKCPESRSNIVELDTVCGLTGGAAQVNTIYDTDGTVTAITKEQQGKTVERKELYPSGQLRSINTPDLYQSFYEDGVLKEEVITSGKQGQDKLVSEYYPTGKPKARKQSAKGALTEMRAWYLNDKVKYVVLYHYGPDTVEVKTYHGNGELHETYTYVPDGQHWEFSPYFSMNASLIKQSKRYYDNGNLHEEIQRNSEGDIVETVRYHETGKLRKTVKIHNDETQTVMDYDANGQLTKQATYYPDGSVK